jgi:hypothetical protein
MPEPQALPLEIGGGMWDSGDGAKAPESSTRLQQNLTRYSEGLVKRNGFRVERVMSLAPYIVDGSVGGISVNAWYRGGFGYRNSGSAKYLCYAAGYAAGGVGFGRLNFELNTSAASGWRWLGSASGAGTPVADAIGVVPFRDLAIFFGRDVTSGLSVWDGDTTVGSIGVSQPHSFFYNPAQMCSFYGRLYLADYTTRQATYEPESADLFAEYDDASWTKTNVTVTVTSRYGTNDYRQIAVTGATPNLLSPTIANAAVAAVRHATVDFLVEVAAEPVPIKIELTDAATGTVIYASKEATLPASTDNSGWISIAVKGEVPATTDYKVRIRFYNTSGTAPSGVKIGMGCKEAFDGRPRGMWVTLGPYSYPHPNWNEDISGAKTSDYTPLGSRYTLFSSEINQEAAWPFDWFYSLVEEAGKITCLYSHEGTMFVGKEDAIWRFSYSDDPNIRITLASFVRGIGIADKECIDSYDGKVYISDKNGLYVWAGERPELIIHEGMRKKVYEDNTPPRSMAIDKTRGIMYLSNGTKLWACELKDNAWSEIPVPALTEIYNMIWGKFEGDTDAVLRLAVNYNGALKVVSMSGEGSKDNITGSDVSVESKYIFHVVQTPAPFKDMQVDFLELDHEITDDSANDTFTLDYSIDDGASWTSLGNFALAEITSGTDTTTLTFPVNRTIRRALFRLTHTGRGGDAVFNFNGARLLVQPLGTSIRPTGATSA